MKSSILHLLSLFLVFAVTSSCGKDSSGGGGGGSNVDMAQTPYVAPTGSSEGETAYNQLKAWYEGSSDQATVGIHGAFLKKTVNNIGYISPIMCQKSLIGIPGCTAPSGCFKVTNQGVMKGVVVMTGSDNKRYSDCDISTINLYSKSSDQDLKDAVLGKAGLFIIKSMTQQTNSIFKVYYGSFDGSTTAVAMAEINVSLPAIVNPTISPVGTSQHNRLIDYRIIQ